MKLGLKGLKLFITAGASGIGRQIIESFLSEGADVSTCDIDHAALAELRLHTRLFQPISAMCPTVQLYRP